MRFSHNLDPDRPIVNDRYRVFKEISFPPSMLRLAEVDGRLCLASRMELASVRNGLLVPAAGGKP